MSFGDVTTTQGLNELNNFLANNSYICGYTPSNADLSILNAVGKLPAGGNYPHVARWYRHIASYDQGERSTWTGTVTTQNSNDSKAKVENDDLDLFGSDEEDDEEAERIRKERVAAYAEKKSKKPAVIAKSSILLDVKPWDDETDMSELEKAVRAITMDGLVWGASKLAPVSYGIKKLQIICVIEDDKVSVDVLTEKIQESEDYVQSVDIAAFNKI